MSDKAVPSTTDTSYWQQRLHAQDLGWRRVLDHIDEGIVIVDHTGVMREVNRTAADWLQQPIAQLVGQPWAGPLVSGPCELKVADQSAYFEAQLEPIEWNDHPAHLIVLRPAAPANQLTAAACATLLHAIPEVVLITRLSDGLVIGASDFAQQALGYSREALIGHAVSPINAWAEPDEQTVFISRLRDTGLCQNFATSFRTRTGQTIPVLLSGRVVELDGQPCILSVARNISEWQQLEEALQASRERYRTLIHNVSIAIYRTTPGARGAFLMTNHALCTMLGYTEDELRQIAVADVYQDPADRQKFSNDVLEHDRVTNLELQLRRKNGSVFWGAVNAQVARDTSGVVAYFDCTMEDITARKQAEKLLHDANQRLQAIIQASALAIIVADAEGIVQVWNPAAERLFGWSAAEAIGQFNPIVPADKTDQFHQDHRRILRGETEQSGEIRRQRKDGRPIDLLVSRAALYDEHGQPTGAVAILADITDRKRAEAAEREQHTLAEALRDTAAALSSTLNFDEVLDRILENVGKIVPYDSASIALIEGRTARFARVRGYVEPGTEAVIMTYRFDLDTTEDLLYSETTGLPVIISDVAHYPGWLSIPGRAWIQSHLGVPIHVKGQAVGYLSLESAVIRFFTAQHAEHLQSFAAQAAVAIENAQLYQQIRQYAEELETRVLERTAELDRERQRLRAILDTAGEGIFFTDRQGSIEYINPAMERLTGYASAEVLGHDPSIWRSGRTPAAVFDTLWRTILRGEVWQGEVINRRKDETLYDSAVMIAPLVREDQQISGFVAIARDITRQKELDRLKDQFVANVSHELRSPLTNVKLHVNLLEHGAPVKRDQYLQTLRREVSRLEALIENLLSLSRLDMGQLTISLGPIDLNRLVSQLAYDRRSLTAETGLLLETRLDQDLSPAQADERLLSQILSNLMTNATHYTPPGGSVMLSTATRQQDDQDWITVTVTDTGPGISTQDMPHLFERFYRGEAGRRSGTPGTGLGLAICHDIALRLNGRITVDSQPGRGAAFTVWLRPGEAG
jgi:PAS domain S-box-containing protein